MKIISYTMVNNEAEIIESFIRYNINFLDCMYIIDNGCTDGTTQIIHNLIAEGLQIKLFDESLLLYQQREIEGKYYHKILYETDADIVVPLDADEFLQSVGNPREYLEALPMDRVTLVPWRWYVLRPEDDEQIAYIPERMKYALKEFPKEPDGKPTTKVIIPTKLAKKYNIEPITGHHNVDTNDKIKIEYTENVNFGHFRIISKNQFISKTMCHIPRIMAFLNSRSIELHVNAHLQKMLKEKNQSTLVYTSVFSAVYNYGSNVDLNSAYHDCELFPLDKNYSPEIMPQVIYEELAYSDPLINVFNVARVLSIREYLKGRNIYYEKQGNSSCILIIEMPINTEDYLWHVQYAEKVWHTVKKHFDNEKVSLRAIVSNDSFLWNLKIGHRLVINPAMMKFIPFDYIVYFEEGNTLEEIRKYPEVVQGKLIDFKNFSCLY